MGCKSSKAAAATVTAPMLLGKKSTGCSEHSPAKAYQAPTAKAPTAVASVHEEVAGVLHNEVQVAQSQAGDGQATDLQAGATGAKAILAESVEAEAIQEGAATEVPVPGQEVTGAQEGAERTETAAVAETATDTSVSVVETAGVRFEEPALPCPNPAPEPMAVAPSEEPPMLPRELPLTADAAATTTVQTQGGLTMESTVLETIMQKVEDMKDRLLPRSLVEQVAATASAQSASAKGSLSSILGAEVTNWVVVVRPQDPTCPSGMVKDKNLLACCSYRGCETV